MLKLKIPIINPDNYSSIITIKFVTTTLVVMGMFAATASVTFDVFAQTNSSSGEGLSTPLEELQDAEFSQVVLSSTQIDELINTVTNATQAAEDGNMTKVIVDLKVLQNQLDVIKQQATMFDP